MHEVMVWISACCYMLGAAATLELMLRSGELDDCDGPIRLAIIVFWPFSLFVFGFCILMRVNEFGVDDEGRLTAKEIPHVTRVKFSEMNDRQRREFLLAKGRIVEKPAAGRAEDCQ